MKNWNKFVVALFVTVVCLTLILSLAPGRSAAEPAASQSTQEPSPVVMIALPWDDPTIRIPPPRQFSAARAPTAATFTINYLSAGTPDGQGATCLAWNSSAQAAFSYAASIWASLLNSPVPIRINACWANLSDPDVLGYSGSNLTRDFTGAPVASTWYAYSLADALHGSDLFPADADFFITYNNGFSWYFGTDGNTPSGQYDFVSVVLHEMGHGLNFAGSMNYGASRCGMPNYGCWGYGSGRPNIYDRFTENGAGQALLDTGLFPNPSTALGIQLKSNNIYFDGTNANAANGGNRVKLYAPNPWAPGSSYSHLDYNTFAGTPNRLMVYAIPSASSIHDPGPVAMGLLKDLGWLPPSTVWVDDDYNSSTLGWNWDHFGSIQSGINAVASDGTVTVYAGMYTETVTLNKSATVSLNGNIMLSGNLSLSTGTLNATSNMLALTGDLARLGGTFNHSNGTVAFNGSAAQNISGAMIFYNLTINNASGVTLTTNIQVHNVLRLQSGDLNTGANTLTMPNGADADDSGVGDVVGTVQRTGIVPSTAYEFGNPNVRLTFANQGTLPASVTITLTKTAPSGLARAVQRTYRITPSGGSGFSATVRLHYLDSELGGTNEAQLKLYRYDGARWVLQGRDSADTTANWVEALNRTAFSDWALTDISTPTAVTLSSFRARAGEGGSNAWIIPTLLLGVGGAVVIGIMRRVR